MIEVLSTAEMRAADARTTAGGVPGIELMERAGQAVAECLSRRWPDARRVLVLCGPGNNGGDGFVAARHLEASGLSVDLVLFGERDSLRGDAALAAASWMGRVLPAFSADRLAACDVVIDALFGAGLARPLDGEVHAAVEAANASRKPILAVDVPSGLDGDSGRPLGTCVRASATVTFFRPKPGHLLLPGRALCGEVEVAQIGIRAGVLDAIQPEGRRNVPELWRERYPVPAPEGHKYDRGHAVVLSGAESPGAARMASRAALRGGAGLVTLLADRHTRPIQATALEAVMVRQADTAGDVSAFLQDPRCNAVLIGPGAGVGPGTCGMVAAAASGTEEGGARALVLDADALTSFSGDPDTLFTLIRDERNPAVFTPHEGEFRRVFPDISGDEPKWRRAQIAAERSGAVVLIKGGDTVVAAPDGRVAFADNAPPWLATAGSGDVLAGIVLALLSQHMPPFEAACAAVWLHGEAGREAGPGLIAEDLPDALRPVIRRLFHDWNVPGA